MLSVINNSGRFYGTEVYVHQIKMAGAKIYNPCINLSELEITKNGTDVNLGLMLFKN